MIFISIVDNLTTDYLWAGAPWCYFWCIQYHIIIYSFHFTHHIIIDKHFSLIQVSSCRTIFCIPHAQSKLWLQFNNILLQVLSFQRFHCQMFTLFHVAFLNKTSGLVMNWLTKCDGVRWTAFYLSFWSFADNRLSILLKIQIIIALSMDLQFSYWHRFQRRHIHPFFYV